MRKLAIIAAVFALIDGGLSKAEEQGTKECFSIVVAQTSNPGMANFNLGSILLDKCTGETWMLVRTTVGKGASGNRWFPILKMKNEATFDDVAAH